VKKPAITVLIILLVIALTAGGIKFFLDNSDDSKENNDLGRSMQSKQKSKDSKDSPKAELATGRYGEYKESDLENSNYNRNIIFFYAPWCPECQAFKTAITSNEINDGVQILEADYDSSTDLKKKYGITLQSTFVKVDSSGTAQKKWVGYGKDKSLNSVLTNLQ